MNQFNLINPYRAYRDLSQHLYPTEPGLYMQIISGQAREIFIDDVRPVKSLGTGLRSYKAVEQVNQYDVMVQSNCIYTMDEWQFITGENRGFKLGDRVMLKNGTGLVFWTIDKLYVEDGFLLADLTRTAGIVVSGWNVTDLRLVTSELKDNKADFIIETVVEKIELDEPGFYGLDTVALTFVNRRLIFIHYGKMAKDEELLARIRSTVRECPALLITSSIKDFC